MREILGGRRRTRTALLGAAITCVEQWNWPVVPAVLPAPARPAGAAGPSRPARPVRDRGEGGEAGEAEDAGDGGGRCSCPRPDCLAPGAHPYDPPLLAATTDPRMVRWWWGEHRPQAALAVATGERVCAVSLPAEAGELLLGHLDAFGIRTGPVIGTPSRYLLLVAPYTHEELGDMLARQEWVPTSLRYHGPGGYLLLPPSRIPTGELRWVREPLPPPGIKVKGARIGVGGVAPWLPPVSGLIDALVAASVSAPDGTRLAY